MSRESRSGLKILAAVLAATTNTSITLIEGEVWDENLPHSFAPSSIYSLDSRHIGASECARFDFTLNIVIVLMFDGE